MAKNSLDHVSTKWIVKKIRSKYVTKNMFLFFFFFNGLETELVPNVHNPKLLLRWSFLMSYCCLSLQASEESWAHRLQSDETCTEAQTPVSSFPLVFFFGLPFDTSHLARNLVSPFVPGKRRVAVSATRSGRSPPKQTPWLILASCWERGWGRKKSKVPANHSEGYCLCDWELPLL